MIQKALKRLNSTSFLQGVQNFKPATLIKTQPISHNVKLFTFKLDSQDQFLDLPIAQHVLFKATINGEQIIRKYTPTTPHTTQGYFQLPIKVYYQNEKWPTGGYMSRHLFSLSPGDQIQVSGPRGSQVYTSSNTMQIKEEPHRFSKLCFVAGGTGLTPCFQIIQYIISQNHPVQLFFLYGNQKQQDIIFKSKLDQYAKQGKLKLHYTLDSPPENWTHFKGYFSTQMISKAFPEPASDTLVCHCGSKAMNAHLKPLLVSMNYFHHKF